MTEREKEFVRDTERIFGFVDITKTYMYEKSADEDLADAKEKLLQYWRQ